MIHFITGSEKKFNEAKRIISDLAQLKMDLPEIQEIDSQKIIEAKLEEAFMYRNGEFVVEDVSLYMDCLNGLPGPLIKWFLKTLGTEGIYNVAKNYENFGAKAKVMLGYSGKDGEIKFFNGSVRGKIVYPKLKTDFGWDPIFQPDGCDKSYAELRKENPDFMSVRKIAFSKLENFLKNESQVS